MQSELKPCPFCSEQCATLVIDQGDKWAHYEPSCLEVRTGYDLSDDAAWRAEAIAVWNNRASDAEITRLTEALRAAEEREKGLREALGDIVDQCGECGGYGNYPAEETVTGKILWWDCASPQCKAARAALKGPNHDT